MDTRHREHVKERSIVSCTTILVGKSASADGSPIVARNEDSPNGEFTPKRVVVVHPEDQPRTYTSVIGHLTIDLTDEPMRYTAVPNALPNEGIWAEAGINDANVAMSATETLTTNPRVLGADPFVEYTPDHAGGIGEEDFVTLVLPYIHTAREGVLRLGALLEQYGTYEMNGTAFSDADEIWWMETVGGHHWIAKRVPDDEYVTMPNQLGIDDFDIEDALGAGRDHLASADLRSFIDDHDLDLTIRDSNGVGTFNPRDAFGSHSDADHVYNTPRAWYIQRALNPSSADWAGATPRLTPFSDNIPWSRKPERKLTIEDVKYVLSTHYQGTEYDPYGTSGTPQTRGLLRPIGINRHSQLSALQVRADRPESSRGLQWVAFASNPFNTLVPFYTNVTDVPAYLSNTTAQVTTENFYWSSRLLAALADAHFNDTAPEIERYQEATVAASRAIIHATDAALAADPSLSDSEVIARLEAANAQIVDAVRDATDEVLANVLLIASNGMKNRFARSDG